LELVHETPGPIASSGVISYLSEEWAAKGLLGKFVDDYRARAQSVSGGVWPSPLPADDFLDGYIGRKAVELVEHYDDPRPLCLFVGFGGPHDPWDAPLPYATMYRAEETPKPVPIPASDPALPETVRDKRDFAAFPQPVVANVANIRANYYGKISLIDDQVGRIVAALERKGWLDDTLIVFVSDHGEMLGDHGRFKKSTFHEANVRVPLLARWPGRIPAGKVTDALVEIVDLFPTLVEAAAAKPSTRCLGRSLWPLIDGERAEVKTWQISEVVYGEARVMLRSRKWKLAIDARGVVFMLYDLEHDPDEQRNLAADPASSGAKNALKRALAATLAELRYGPGVFPGLE